MDGRRQLTVKAHRGETITAADGFYVIDPYVLLNSVRGRG
jgi:hypothetical protein